MEAPNYPRYFQRQHSHSRHYPRTMTTITPTPSNFQIPNSKDDPQEEHDFSIPILPIRGTTDQATLAATKLNTLDNRMEELENMFLQGFRDTSTLDTFTARLMHQSRVKRRVNRKRRRSNNETSEHIPSIGEDQVMQLQTTPRHLMPLHSLQTDEAVEDEHMQQSWRPAESTCLTTLSACSLTGNEECQQNIVQHRTNSMPGKLLFSRHRNHPSSQKYPTQYSTTHSSVSSFSSKVTTEERKVPQRCDRQGGTSSPSYTPSLHLSSSMNKDLGRYQTWSKPLSSTCHTNTSSYSSSTTSSLSYDADTPNSSPATTKTSTSSSNYSASSIPSTDIQMEDETSSEGQINATSRSSLRKEYVYRQKRLNLEQLQISIKLWNFDSSQAPGYLALD